MSAVPKLMRWTQFVRDLGGLVVLDVAWECEATAEFPDDADGALNVVCGLDDNGDLDVTRRPRLEGEKIRDHPKAVQAMAAFAYVNPGFAGDGEAVSRESHAGAWHPVTDQLAVAQAKDGTVGGVRVGGRGAFLVHKGRLWLPNGPQGRREDPTRPQTPPEPEKTRESVSEAPDERTHTRTAPTPPESAQEAPETSQTPAATRRAPEPSDDPAQAPPRSERPRRRERRSRIFGEEADELITQARSAGRRRA